MEYNFHHYSCLAQLKAIGIIIKQNKNTLQSIKIKKGKPSRTLGPEELHDHTH